MEGPDGQGMLKIAFGGKFEVMVSGLWYGYAPKIDRSLLTRLKVDSTRKLCEPTHSSRSIGPSPVLWQSS